MLWCPTQKQDASDAVFQLNKEEESTGQDCHTLNDVQFGCDLRVNKITIYKIR